MADEANPELETFRKQWREEVTARSKVAYGHQQHRRSRPAAVKSASQSKLSGPPLTTRELKKEEQETAEDELAKSYHDQVDKDKARRLGETGEGVYPSKDSNREPRSALEHFERAVEKEAQGNLGDSLNHYRKAYRLDAGVDKAYRSKYFPPSSFRTKPADPNPSNAPVTVPNPAHHSLDGPISSTISQLIASFSEIGIAPTPPPTEHSLALPCPISTIPSEILTEIVERAAVLDVAAFARLSLVCKRLAHLIATSDLIWKRICLGSEFGFAGMHYIWRRAVDGSPLHEDDGNNEFGEDALSDVDPVKGIESEEPTVSLSLSAAYPTYQIMFRTRPRLRFNGCYISTVNYVRPGASSPTQISWNTPVHIVTYYRYLRFFRDGTCVSLLTTSEPVDVVHYLTREHMHSSHAVGSMLPSAVMRNALRGRWRLSGSVTGGPKVDEAREAESEGDVLIETEGPDREKYMYKMQLALKSASPNKRARNNKMIWRGFWSYNKLTDDWAEFGLRNDRAFFWSRVKSYGMGY